MWSKIVSVTIYWELNAKYDDDAFSSIISHNCNNPEKEDVEMDAENKKLNS